MSSQPPQEDVVLPPKCIASTEKTFCAPTRRTPNASGVKSGSIWPSNLFREAQFSPDGTTIITFNEDQCLRSFVLPPELLDENSQPHSLEAHAEHKAGTNVQSYAIYPHFNLQDSSTTLVLTGCKDVPVTLRNALHYSTVHGNYPLVNALTEAHLPPSSLAFIDHGQHFLAGSENLIAAFDCRRDGSEPVVKHQLRLGKKSKSAQVDSWSMTRKGRATALAVSRDRLLAAGTTQREIGIYADEGLGECASVFSPDGANGDGITSLKWSPDGTYLIAAERQSDSIQVFDVRNLQRRVACLLGRQADTSQRLGIDMIPTRHGCEVWAGGTDGCVRMWANPGLGEVVKVPDAEFKLHDAVVSGTIWHPSGAVLATCSGKRFEWRDERNEDDVASDDEEATSEVEELQAANLVPMPDNTLKVWTV